MRRSNFSVFNWSKTALSIVIVVMGYALGAIPASGQATEAITIRFEGQAIETSCPSTLSSYTEQGMKISSLATCTPSTKLTLADAPPQDDEKELVGDAVIGPYKFEFLDASTFTVVSVELVSVASGGLSTFTADPTGGVKAFTDISIPGIHLFPQPEWTDIEFFTWTVNTGSVIDNLVVIKTPSMVSPAQPTDVTVDDAMNKGTIHWASPHTFCKDLTTLAPGATSAHLRIIYKESGSPPPFTEDYPMTQTSPDMWCGDIPAPLFNPEGQLHGQIEVRILVVPMDPSFAFWQNWEMFIDPSGIVTDAVTGEPIEGAIVTLQKCQSISGSCSTALQGEYIPDENPLLTTASGGYGWDVIPGFYRVHVEKTGYQSTDSDIVEIPPPVLDLDVQLQPIQGPQEPTTLDPALLIGLLIIIVILLIIIIVLLIIVIRRQPSS